MNHEAHFVLVTGGATGIGRAIATQLADAGHHVTVCGRRQDRLDRLNAADPRIRIVRADITRPQEREAALHTAAGPEGVTMLVNNAAIFRPTIDFPQDFTEASIEEQVATNVVAPLALTRAFLAQRPQDKTTVILNIGSLAAWLPIGTQAVYGATKSALNGFSRSLRELVRAEAMNVKVFEVMTPGVDTEMTTSVDIPKMNPDTLATRILRDMKRGRQEILIGPDAFLAYYGQRFFPWLVRFIVRRKVRYHAETRSAAPTPS